MRSCTTSACPFADADSNAASLQACTSAPCYEQLNHIDVAIRRGPPQSPLVTSVHVSAVLDEELDNIRMALL